MANLPPPTDVVLHGHELQRRQRARRRPTLDFVEVGRAPVEDVLPPGMQPHHAFTCRSRGSGIAPGEEPSEYLSNERHWNLWSKSRYTRRVSK